MNEGLMQIKTRRSVRKYKPDMVPKEILDQILEAGTYAPTAMNRQSPILIAVTNKEVRDRLSKLNASIMGTDSDPFYGAPVVVIVLADKSVGTRVYDGSPAGTLFGFPLIKKRSGGGSQSCTSQNFTEF